MAHNFRTFLHRPSLHQDWGQSQQERKITWTELFFDLFMVAAISNFSHHVIYHPNGSGVGQFFLFYTLFYYMWSSNAIFKTRVKLEGFCYDVIELILHIGILGMVVTCGDLAYHAVFAGSYAVARAASVVNHLITAHTIPRARDASLCYGFFQACMAAAALAVAIAGSQAAFVGVAIGLCAAEILSPYAPALLPSARLPVHVDHTAERTGLFMMIALGETIVGIGLEPLAGSARQYAGIALAGVVIWNLHLMYYHTNPEQHDHALRLSRYRGIAWSSGHFVLGAGFLLTGAGLRLALATYLPPSEGGPDPASELEQLDSTTAWLACGCYAACYHLMFALRALHYMRCDERNFIAEAFAGTHLANIADIWWALGFVWPLMAYFIAFTADSLKATGVLALLAAHGLIGNTIETFITFLITRHPNFKRIAQQRHHARKLAAVHQRPGPLELSKLPPIASTPEAGAHPRAPHPGDTAADADVSGHHAVAVPEYAQTDQGKDVVAREETQV